MWSIAAMGLAQAGLSFLDSRNKAKEAKKMRKLIDKRKNENKREMKMLGVDARASQDWAANQLMKNRNNPAGSNAIANMFSNKVNSAKEGISGLRRENTQLEMSKPSSESWQSSALGALGTGIAGASTMYASMGDNKDKEGKSAFSWLNGLF
jgi:hypothetical protein